MKRAFLPPTCILALLWAAGCGPSSEEKDDKGQSVAKRLDAAKEAMEEARQAGADRFAAQEFDDAAKKIEEAEALVAEDKAPRAKSKATSAERTFRDLVRRAAEVKTAQSGALASKDRAEKAVAAAKKQGFDKAAPEEFEEVERDLSQAKADFDAGTSAKIASAQRVYDRIQDKLKDIRKVAAENKSWKEKAGGERKAALEAEGKAKGANAGQHAADDLARAARQLRDGDIEYKNAKFREAYDHFQGAAIAYADAENRARQAEEFARLTAQPAPDPKDAAAAPRKDAPAAAAPKGPQQPTPAADVADVRPGELDPEDEIFLQENIRKFCAQVEPAYDSTSGEFTVEYPFGDQMRKDLLYPLGMNPKHIVWRDVLMGGIGAKQAKGQKELGLSFGGNTLGFFLFPFPFKEKLTFEYEVELGMMKTGGSLGPVLMSSKDAKNYICCNFGSIEVFSGGRKTFTFPPTDGDPQKRKDPNMWFIKTKRVGMKMIYEPAAAKEGEEAKFAKVELWYDTDGDVDKPACESSKVPLRGGFAGFSWRDTKFNIRMLKITGKLDKEAAVKILREKLGKPEAGNAGGQPAAGDPPPKGGGAPKVGAAPTKGPKKGDQKAGNGEEKEDY